MLGDLETGYMVLPTSDAVRERLMSRLPLTAKTAPTMSGT
jgi:predicted RNase H-like nuclease